MNHSALVVDDEVLMREVLVRWLRAAGYRTREVHDAATALTMVAASEPDVILVDIQMPGRDGLWLVAQLRERFPNVAIVLATALDTVPPAVSLQEGVVEYLVKPFERERVVAAVKRAAEWRQQAVSREPRRVAARDAVGEWFHSGRPPAKGQ